MKRFPGRLNPSESCHRCFPGHFPSPLRRDRDRGWSDCGQLDTRLCSIRMCPPPPMSFPIPHAQYQLQSFFSSLTACQSFTGKEDQPQFLLVPCPSAFHGQRNLVGYSPKGRKESDMTEHALYPSLCAAPATLPSSPVVPSQQLRLLLWALLSLPTLRTAIPGLSLTPQRPTVRHFRGSPLQSLQGD